MKAARPQYASKLDFVVVEDFTKSGVFDDALEGIDAVIHVASVCNHPNYKHTCTILTSTALLLRHQEQRTRTHHPSHQRREIHPLCLRQIPQHPTHSPHILLRRRRRHK